MTKVLVAEQFIASQNQASFESSLGYFSIIAIFPHDRFWVKLVQARSIVAEETLGVDEV